MIHHPSFFWCWAVPQVQVLNKFSKAKSKSQCMFWVPDPKRISIRFLLFNKIALLFSSKLSICTFSVQSFAEHRIAFPSRYSCNCAFKWHHGLMWLPVTIFDYDGSVFPATSPHRSSVKFNFSWRELCHPLPVICYCPLSLSSTCWCSDCQRRIIWFWKASSSVNALGYFWFYLDSCITVSNCYFGLY